MRNQLTQEQLMQHLGRIGGILAVTILLIVAFLFAMQLVASLILIKLVQ